MFFINGSSKEAIYEQLKKQIIELIAIQVLQPNDKLPSIRALAIQLGVNPNTVAKAYQQLEEEGLIYSLSGKGCFIASQDSKVTTYKLNEFKEVVQDMYKHEIEKVDLIQIVDEIYKGSA